MTPERQQEWAKTHQPWELKYHQQGNFRWPGREHLWDSQWQRTFGFADLTPESFEPSDTMLDVGCGSRPALDFFLSGQKHFIDPLLESYLKIPQMHPHWKPHDPERLNSVPAEQMVEPLRESCDFVLCWNVLDHTYDPFAILRNIKEYMKPGSRAYIGTDISEKPHIGHPGIVSKSAFLSAIRDNFNVIREGKQDSFEGSRQAVFLLQKP
jgi:SAM-dependent methyltransferase